MNGVNLTKAKDLGEIDGPLLICGGAYSNFEALTAFFVLADKLGIPSQQIIHTGDAIAYCANPRETTELLAEKNVHVIQGNVEDCLAKRAPNCGCGFDEGSTCDALSQRWFAYADALVCSDLRSYMRALPHQLTFKLSGYTFRVVHGGVKANNTFFYPSSNAVIYKEEFAAARADIIIGGHSGLPFTRTIGKRIWHNSGALGLPANDGTPRVWCSCLLPGKTDIHFIHHALDYDYETARQKMLRAKLPEGYADALATGLWPSLENLPPAEQLRTGKMIHFATEPQMTTEALMLSA